jgi:hypothetical protein
MERENGVDTKHLKYEFFCDLLKAYLDRPPLGRDVIC